MREGRESPPRCLAAAQAPRHSIGGALGEKSHDPPHLPLGSLECCPAPDVQVGCVGATWVQDVPH